MTNTVTILTAIITAYTHTSHPTACGRMPTIHHTIAAPRIVPIGTVVEIDNHRYVVEDRTAKKYDGRWDIFMNTQEECVKHGKQTNTVKIIWQPTRKE